MNDSGLVFIFLIGYFSDYGNKELILEGSYQSEGVGKSGHFLQITFMEGKFYEYEDNILINSGEYKKKYRQCLSFKERI